MPTSEVLSVRLQAVDLVTAAEQVVDLASRREGGLVVTMNVDHAVKLQEPGVLRDAYDAAVLRYADGMPIVWLARLLGRPLPARVAGSDLVPLVLELAAERDLSVYLVGGEPAVAAEAASRVRAAYPTLTWHGEVSPPRGFERDPQMDRALAEMVAAGRPDIVLVCLGAPKQEAWALRHLELFDGAALLCVGATVDFLAGTTSRAPTWISRNGLEWLFRLALEPRRLWRRYLIDDRRFLQLAVRELIHDRRRRAVVTDASEAVRHLPLQDARAPLDE